MVKRLLLYGSNVNSMFGNKKGDSSSSRLPGTERAKGVEPSSRAWEARVMPLYDAR